MRDAGIIIEDAYLLGAYASSASSAAMVESFSASDFSVGIVRLDKLELFGTIFFTNQNTPFSIYLAASTDLLVRRNIKFF